MGWKKASRLILLCAPSVLFAASAAGSPCPTLYRRIVDHGAASLRAVRESRLNQIKRKAFDYLKGLHEGSIPNAVAWQSLSRPDDSLVESILNYHSALWRRLGGLVAAPLGPRRPRNELEGIFFRLWKNPDFVPDTQETALLRRHDLLDLFTKRRDFLRRHRYAPFLKDAAARTTGGLVLLELGLLGNQARELAKDPQTFEEYVDAPNEDERGLPLVQLLVESPVPHTALRIGATVYSYGTDHLNVSTVADYLDGASSSLPVATTNWRTIRATNLKLTPEQIRSLRRDLELSRGKVYHNESMVNDCATMVARALESHGAVSIPTAIDPLPSIGSTYLSLRHLMGDGRVGATTLLRPKALPGREAFLAAMVATMAETKLALYSAPLLAGQRAYLSVTTPPERLAYFTPEQTQKIEEWKTSARKSTTAEIEALLNSYGDAGRDRPSPALRASIAGIFATKEQRLTRELESFSTTIEDLVVTEEKLSTLRALRAEWEQRLDGK